MNAAKLRESRVAVTFQITPEMHKQSAQLLLVLRLRRTAAGCTARPGLVHETASVCVSRAKFRTSRRGKTQKPSKAVRLGTSPFIFRGQKFRNISGKPGRGVA